MPNPGPINWDIPEERTINPDCHIRRNQDAINEYVKWERWNHEKTLSTHAVGTSGYKVMNFYDNAKFACVASVYDKCKFCLLKFIAARGYATDLLKGKDNLKKNKTFAALLTTLETTSALSASDIRKMCGYLSQNDVEGKVCEEFKGHIMLKHWVECLTRLTRPESGCLYNSHEHADVPLFNIDEF